MHYMHYKDYIHHGLAAEKTPPPLPQGGGTIWLGGGGCGGPCSYIYIYVWNSMQTKWSIRLYNAELWRAKRFLAISVPVLLVARVYNVSCDDGCDNALLRDWHKHCGKQSHLDDRTELWDIWWLVSDWDDWSSHFPNLVGGFKHFIFHNIWDVILPIDELHDFSRWFLHHQPDYN